MSIYSPASLRKILLDASAVAALVGTRVSFVQDTTDTRLDRIIIQRVSDVPSRNHGGVGYRTARFQVTCLSATPKGADALADAARAALEAYATSPVDYIDVENVADLPGDRLEGEDIVSFYGVALDAVIQYH
jgi:hypothetical protein